MPIDRCKVGIRSTSSEKYLLSGYSVLPFKDDLRVIILSKNCALYLMICIENNENVSVQVVRSLGYLYYHCLEKYLTITKVKSHISSQHVGPVNCKMC